MIYETKVPALKKINHTIHASVKYGIDNFCKIVSVSTYTIIHYAFAFIFCVVTASSESFLLAISCIINIISFTLHFAYFILKCFYQHIAGPFRHVRNLIIFLCLFVGLPTLKYKIDSLEDLYKTSIDHIIFFEVDEYLTKLNTYPFNKIKPLIDTLHKTESELDICLEKLNVKAPLVKDIIARESIVRDLPIDLVYGILSNENKNLDPNAFFAKNRDGSLDIGIMQINSKNLKYCDITLQQAFTPIHNIKCGMRLLKDAYITAKTRAANGAKSCTGAKSKQQLIHEITARIYNGGHGVRGNTSCDYASRLRSKLEGIEIPFIKEEEGEENDTTALQVAQIETKKSFWEKLF